jgi:hypothetical protein
MIRLEDSWQVDDTIRAAVPDGIAAVFTRSHQLENEELKSDMVSLRLCVLSVRMTCAEYAKDAERDRKQIQKKSPKEMNKSFRACKSLFIFLQPHRGRRKIT